MGSSSARYGAALAIGVVLAAVAVLLSIAVSEWRWSLLVPCAVVPCTPLVTVWWGERTDRR